MRKIEQVVNNQYEKFYKIELELRSKIQELTSLIVKLESIIEKQNKALEFYADENMWTTIVVQGELFDGFVDGDFCDAFDADREKNRQDSGQRAREVLEEVKGMKDE